MILTYVKLQRGVIFMNNQNLKLIKLGFLTLNMECFKFIEYYRATGKRDIEGYLREYLPILM